MTYTDLLPALTDEQYEALKADIAERGCLVPVELDEAGVPLDGAHRLRACAELGIKPPTIVRRGLSEDEKQAHAIALNLQRRQLTREQRQELHRELRAIGKSAREIAALSGVSHPTVLSDLAGGQDLPPAVKGRDGKSYPASRPKPAPILSFPEQPQQEAAVTAQEHRRSEQRAERRANPPAAPDLPEGTFSVLYCDPPWRYEHAVSESRAVENQYPTLTLDEIKALAVPAADDAVLFLWATSPKLAEALEVVDAWGFSYRTCMVWVKDKIGMGYYVRQQHELLLIGKRGDILVPAETSRPSSVVHATRGRHSEKPAEFYGLIERMYPGHARAELFARQERDGWTAWGNEIGAAA